MATTTSTTPSKRQLIEEAALEDDPISSDQKCDLIAELSESILEQPEENMASLQHLLQLARDPEVAQLAVVSLLSIFRDILPSYRITPPTAQQLAVRVSKETKKIWDYERVLLHNYQQYLHLLDKTYQKHHQTPLGLTCALCASELLPSVLHFNLRRQLLELVVAHANRPPPVGDAACRALQTLFAQDAQGSVALEATRLVSQRIVARKKTVRPAVVQTWLALPLRVHADEAQAAKLSSQAHKKKKKKEQTAIEAELKEGEATIDKTLLARNQSDTLQAVTLAYFKILKQQGSSSDALLPAALEGLAKVAHLINMDTVMDLLAVFRDLLQRVDDLPLEASLHCILTAFQTLQGPGKELKIDMKEYMIPLYNQLPRVQGDTTVLLLLECLQVALLQRREFSVVRLAAMTKRILTVALHGPATVSVPLLAFVRQLFQRYDGLEQLLESEQDVVLSGRYTPEVEDPEHAYPLATSAWELALLKFHVNPMVSRQAKHAASQQMMRMPAESPDRLFAEVTRAGDEVYIPFQRNKKKHPLASGSGKEDGKKKQCRFITNQAKETRLGGELDRWMLGLRGV